MKQLAFLSLCLGVVGFAVVSFISTAASPDSFQAQARIGLTAKERTATLSAAERSALSRVSGLSSSPVSSSLAYSKPSLIAKRGFGAVHRVGKSNGRDFFQIARVGQSPCHGAGT